MKRAKLAYAIWPWGLKEPAQMIQALRDIQSLGFRAFESVATAVEMFKDKPAEFKAIVDDAGVYPASFYFWNRGDSAADVRTVAGSLDFLAAAGVRSISIQAAGKKGGATPAELERELRTLQGIGRACKPYGILPCLHPHANTVAMYESEIDFLMQRTDPAELFFGPDTAHLAVGRCDPVAIFERYAQRIRFVHLKDVKKTKPAAGDGGRAQGFEVFSAFLELGEGEVDIDGCLAVLERIGFDGYLTPELDKSRFGNRESAAMNMAYMKARGYA